MPCPERLVKVVAEGAHPASSAIVVAAESRTHRDEEALKRDVRYFRVGRGVRIAAYIWRAPSLCEMPIDLKRSFYL
jgi:hypothetical protein